MFRTVSIVLLLSFAGCGESSCAVPREQCQEGLFFAECPGSVTPVFACQELTGECRWFTGACPRNFRASDCPVGDQCCHTSPEGAWPFDEGWTPPGATIEVVSDVAAFGRDVVDRRAPAEIAVALDPSIGEPSPDGYERIRCSAGTPLRICAGPFVNGSRPNQFDLSWSHRFTDGGLSGDAVYLEVIPTDDVPIARVFVRDENDLFEDNEPRACVEPTLHAVAGTLWLSTFDFSSLEVVHGTLDVAFAGEHTVSIDF